MAQARLSKVAQHLHSNSPPNSGNHTQNAPYQVLEAPIGTTRHIRIVTIGAGASGLNMIRTFRKHLTNYEHVVYEKNAKVGGTWFENRYPGCRCDIPSHNYQFSWRPNPDWSSFFSPAEEIEEYLCQLCEEEHMEDVIKTEHSVVQAEWDEDRGVWKLIVSDSRHGTHFNDWCHFLLDASGILNNWKWPDIPGIHDFGGDLVHSADWPTSFQYSKKRVAVIGNGSSGIQIVPAIQPTVRQLVHFVRSPTWIAPPQLQTLTMGKAASILSEIEVDEKGDFSASQIQNFKSDPAFYRKFVKAVEEHVNSNFPIMLKDEPLQKFGFAAFQNYMQEELGHDESLCKAMIPDFAVGCRRLTPGIGYLASLRASNARVVTEPIVRVVPRGIELASGEIIELDAIICATGFDVSFRPRFPIIGREGNLQDIWTRELPKAYMSCAIPGVPNYFTFLGPNAPIGHGSVFTITEHVAKYITRILQKCQTEGIKALAPAPAAVADFYEHINTFMPRTAWATSCRSWFKNGMEDGPVTALHPGSRIHFFHMLEKFRAEDWHYVYERGTNRFAYLGNGFSVKELGEEDSTWYLDEPDKL